VKYDINTLRRLAKCVGATIPQTAKGKEIVETVRQVNTPKRTNHASLWQNIQRAVNRWRKMTAKNLRPGKTQRILERTGRLLSKIGIQLPDDLIPVFVGVVG
jgi:hypothetical protein